jgi:thiol-disulfide isomerase/thioredoxin
MKKLCSILLAVILFAGCHTHQKTNSTNYRTVQNGNEKILIGYLNRSVIENDTAFKWFKQNMQYGTAYAPAIESFKAKSNHFKLMVFAGTWCEDSQNLLPVFYRLLEKSNFSEKNVTLIGVDRNKTTIEDLHTKYSITRVPTFIILKNGKEVARVVEYGKYAQIDKELGEIVDQL